MLPVSLLVLLIFCSLSPIHVSTTPVLSVVESACPEPLASQSCYGVQDAVSRRVPTALAIALNMGRRDDTAFFYLQNF